MVPPRRPRRIARIGHSAARGSYREPNALKTRRRGAGYPLAMITRTRVAFRTRSQQVSSGAARITLRGAFRSVGQVQRAVRA